jgi:hypothetical protein
MIRGSPAASRRRIATISADVEAARTSSAGSTGGRFRSCSRDSSVSRSGRDRSAAASATTVGSVEACLTEAAKRCDVDPAAGAPSEDGRTSRYGSTGKTRWNQGLTGLFGVARAIGDRLAIRPGGRADAGATAWDVRVSASVRPGLGTTERSTPCGVVAVEDTAVGGRSRTATTAGRVSAEDAGVAAGAGAGAPCEFSA